MLTEALPIRDGPLGAGGFPGLHTRRRPDGRVGQRHYSWVIDRRAGGLNPAARRRAPAGQASAAGGSGAANRRTEASRASVVEGLARTPSKTLFSGPS